MLCPSKVRVIKLVFGVVHVRSRTFTTTCRAYASHYDILGITPKATQNDIKSAYYKLSKLYHPDLSPDEASAKKFRAISEAYEILGNISLKKMYDKGLLVGRDSNMRVEYHPTPEPRDPTVKFYKSRVHRNVIPTMDGKSPIYDFDTWSKNHYGELLKKTRYEKEFVKNQRAKRHEVQQATRQEALLYVMFAIGSLFMLMVAHGTTDYDKDATHPQPRR